MIPHPQYNSILPTLTLVEAAYIGKTAWFDDGKIVDDKLAHRFLPSEQSENGGDYIRRLLRSRYKNFFKTTINNLAGLLSQFQIKKETLSWLSEDEKTTQLSNVNLQGADLFSFLLECDRLSLRDGFCGVLIDFPNSGKGRPFLSALERKDIINWELDYTDTGEAYLLKVVFKRCLYRTLADGIKMIQQYIQVEGDGYSVWEMVSVSKETVLGDAKVELSKELKLIEQYPNTLGKVPIIFYPLNTFNPFDVDPPLLDIAESNSTHYQIYSDYRESLHFQSLPIIVREGLMNSLNDTAVLPPLILSPKHAIDVPIGGKVYVVETSGAAIQLNREAFKDIEAEILQATLNYLDSTPMTATEASLRGSQYKANLSVYSSQKTSAVEEIFKLWALWLDKEVEGQGIIIDDSLFIKLDPSMLKFYFDLYIQNALTLDSFWKIIYAMGAVPKGVNVEELLDNS